MVIGGVVTGLLVPSLHHRSHSDYEYSRFEHFPVHCGRRPHSWLPGDHLCVTGHPDDIAIFSGPARVHHLHEHWGEQGTELCAHSQ